jgi:hypothetical protein
MLLMLLSSLHPPCVATLSGKMPTKWVVLLLNVLVTDAVSVLLDGLNGGLDDGGLGDFTDGRKSVGGGGGDGNGGGGDGGGGGVAKRSSSVGKRSSGVGESAGRVALRDLVGVGGGSKRDQASLGGDSQDSKNNLVKGKERIKIQL